VAHRIDTLPVVLDDRLVEIDIATFEQRDSSGGNEHTRHRQVAFALDTENLGHLEINTRLAGKSVRLSLRSADSEITQQLAMHSGALIARLKEFGWELDEIKYETAAEARPGLVPSAVVEHLIARDSLSRLM